MRKLISVFLLTCLSSLLFGNEVEPVDSDKLETREVEGEEICFLKHSEEPYTGKSVEVYENGNKLVNNYYKGKQNGLTVVYYPNTMKACEGFYEDWKMVYAKSWMPNGSLCKFTNVTGGAGVAQIYHRNGKVEWRAEYSNGKLHGLRGSFPSLLPCPIRLLRR